MVTPLTTLITGACLSVIVMMVMVGVSVIVWRRKVFRKQGTDYSEFWCMREMVENGPVPMSDVMTMEIEK